MEAKAQARFIRVTPQKSRRVVNEVRGKRVLEPPTFCGSPRRPSLPMSARCC